MNGRRSVRLRWTAPVVIAGALLGVALGVSGSAARQTPASRMLIQPQDGRSLAETFRVAGLDRSRADISLDIREQTDFLLTPAWLVQEALSDDIVPTYPEE